MQPLHSRPSLLSCIFMLLCLAAANRPSKPQSPVALQKKAQPLALLPAIVQGEKFGVARDCQYTGSGPGVSLISQKVISDDLMSQRAGTYLNYTGRQRAAMERFLLYDGDQGAIASSGPAWHYTLAAEHQRLAICRRLPDANKNLLQIELWDLKKQKLSNAFKADAARCSSRFLFSSDGNKLALLSDTDTRSLEIWKVDPSTKLVLPKELLDKKCHVLSSDFSSVYCSSGKIPLAAYRVDDGKISWRLQIPEEFQLGRLGRLVKNVAQAIGRPTPKSYYNLLQTPPALVTSDEAEKKIYLVFRYPAEQRAGESEQAYPGLVVTAGLTDGKVLAMEAFEEPGELRFLRLYYDVKLHWLVGEDLHHSNQALTSFYVFDLPGKRQQRIGIPCAHAWDLRAGGMKMLTCGHCEEKNYLQVWDLAAQVNATQPLPYPPPAPPPALPEASPNIEKANEEKINESKKTQSSP